MIISRNDALRLWDCVSIEDVLKLFPGMSPLSARMLHKLKGLIPDARDAFLNGELPASSGILLAGQSESRQVELLEDAKVMKPYDFMIRSES